MKTLNSISYFAYGYAAMIVVYVIIAYQAVRQAIVAKR